MLDQDLAQIESPTKTLGEADPKRRAAELRVKATRVDALVQRLSTAVGVVAQP